MAAELPTFLRLEVVTPDRNVLTDEVDEVSIPGSEGYLGILPGHLPLLTMIGTGILSFRKGAKRFNFCVSGGFAEVLPDRVIIMAHTLEKPEEIDVTRARNAKERAEKMLVSHELVDVDQAMAALLRATSRLHVAEMK
jgi:F-type H+-transporting ATPase subunit epsilon